MYATLIVARMRAPRKRKRHYGSSVIFETLENLLASNIASGTGNTYT